MKSKVIGAMCILLLTVAAAQAAAQAPPTADSARIQRLAGLCKVWGAIKYFHPDLATKDIDWDAALVKTIDKVNAAQSADEYRDALNYLLTFLGDPLTKVVEKQTGKAEVAGAAAPQRVFRLTDDKIAIVAMTDYSQFSADSKTDELRKALTDAAQAKAIVLDLRRLSGNDSDVFFFLSSFNQAFPTLL
jgi:hypothetical protein